MWRFVLVKKFKGNKKELVFAIIILVQLIALFVFNLTRLKYQADFDSSSGMVQIIEIWKQKTLLIKNWEYQTTVGWDIPIIFSVILYGLTKNVFLSIGIINNLFILGFLILIYDILKHAGVSRLNRLVTLSLFFAPYTMGQLGYVPMLFTGTASYAMKVMITLLLIDLVMRAEDGKKMRQSIIPLVVLFVFAAISGISSGVYMFACGVVPVAAYLVLNALCRNQLKCLASSKTIYVGAATAAFAVGMVISKFLQFSNSATSMTMIPAGKFGPNIMKCFGGIFELFGAVDGSESPAVMSVQGIVALFSVLFTHFVLFIIVYYTVKVVKKKEQRPIICVLLCVFYINQLILLVTDTNYASDSFEFRYHIASMVPVMLLTGVFMDEVKERVNELCRYTFYILLFLTAAFISVVNYKFYYDKTASGKIDELQPIVDLAKENDAHLIIDIIAESDAALMDGRIMRLCDSNMNVVTYTSYNQGMGWGASSKYYENGRYSGKTLIMIPDDKTDTLPAYVLSRMREVSRMQGYVFYVTEKNILDASTAFENTWNKKSVDFPYSYGFTVEGDIDDQGDLCVKPEGGLAIHGAEMERKEGTYRISLQYKQSETPASNGIKLGEFHVTKADGTILRSVDILSGSGKAVIPEFHFEDDDNVHYEVIVYQNTNLKIHSIMAKQEK